MAPVRVRVCPSCKHPNSVGVIFCSNCRTSIARVEPEDSDGLNEAPRPIQEESEVVRCPDPTCGEINPSGEERCLRCSARLPGGTPKITVRLIWPWGEVRIDDTLAIGRDPDFSPLAESLAAYSNVSRRHAELRIQNGSAFIRDVASSHGTYVNDSVDAIARGEWVPIGDGDRLCFARYGPRAILKLSSDNG